MKAAILISGYLRTLKVNLPQIKSKILDQFDEIDVFIHVTKNESKDDRYFNLNNETEDLIYINNILKPVSLLIEDNIKIHSDKKVNNLHNTWLKFHKLNQLKKIQESLIGQKYDIVIKSRPDLNISSDNIFNEDITKDIIYLPKNSVIDKSKLINPDDKYLCDIFAFGNSSTMDKYLELYINLNDIVSKYGHVSETVLYNYLNNFCIEYKECDIEYSVILSLCNVFAICGDSGSGKTTLGNILESYFSNSFKLECDRYHKWERNDDNWKSFTHLNPDANYLTKMNDDIFDLKIGKTIHQVNYDHANGKFTDKQKIEKSDNLIVCGLHSLYTKNDNLYNLKIFIDTDDTLKKRWKIRRDVEKRGYTVEKVLEQIEKRKSDFDDYILPQREKSDIIINFFTQQPFDINNLFEDVKVHLRVYVNKSHSLIDILSQLSKNNIEYIIDSESNKNYNEIVFYEYKQCQLLENGLLLNNFYDYIVFIILSLNQKNL